MEGDRIQVPAASLAIFTLARLYTNVLLLLFSIAVSSFFFLSYVWLENVANSPAVAHWDCFALLSTHQLTRKG